ncbi:MAG: hypothetical protein AAGC60_11040 [Acidobacteriota bacterium]
MTIERELELIHQLIRQSGKLIEVEMRARIAGENELADEVATRFERLQREIDRLRGRAADGWIDRAEDLHEDLRAANATVQRRIRQIRDGVDVARDVTAVIAAVDDVLALLGGE